MLPSPRLLATITAIVTATTTVTTTVPALAAPATAHREVLTSYATDTWRSMVAMVHPGTELPSDNINGALDPASRARYTSPTNVGMYLWATVSARHLGLIGKREARERGHRTLTVHGLNRHHRHILIGRQFQPGPPGTGRKAHLTHDVPGKSAAAQQITHLDAVSVGPHPRPGHPQHRRGQQQPDTRHGNLVRGVKPNSGIAVLEEHRHHGKSGHEHRGHEPGDDPDFAGTHHEPGHTHRNLKHPARVAGADPESPTRSPTPQHRPRSPCPPPNSAARHGPAPARRH